MTGYGIRDRSPVFVLQWIEKYLFQWGFSDAAADLITFLVACGLAVLLLWLLNFIGTWILTHIVALAVHRSRTLMGRFPDAPPFFQPHHQVPHRGFIALFGPNHLRRLQPGGHHRYRSNRARLHHRYGCTGLRIVPRCAERRL
ncbi:MAG: hypothetical protein ACLR8Y_14775 [Alistipes indistinctus]